MQQKGFPVVDKLAKPIDLVRVMCNATGKFLGNASFLLSCPTWRPTHRRLGLTADIWVGGSWIWMCCCFSRLATTGLKQGWDQIGAAHLLTTSHLGICFIFKLAALSPSHPPTPQHWFNIYQLCRHQQTLGDAPRPILGQNRADRRPSLCHAASQSVPRGSRTLTRAFHLQKYRL